MNEEEDPYAKYVQQPQQPSVVAQPEDDPYAKYVQPQQAQAEEDPYAKYVEKPTVGQYAKEAGKQVGIGIASGPTAYLQGLAGYGERPAGRELESAIEMAGRGVFPGVDEPLVPRAAKSAAENPLYKAGTAIEKGTEALLQPQDILHPVARDVSRGVGSVVGNIATSMVPGMGPGFLAMQGAGEATRTAVEKGATPEQQAQAAQFGNIAGITDLADVLLASLGSTGKSLGLVKRVGLHALEGALTEGGQEGLQQFIQNLIRQGVYDPKHDLLDDVGYSAFIGALTGGLVSGVTPGHREVTGEKPAESQLEDSLNNMRTVDPNIPGPLSVPVEATPAPGPMAQLQAVMAPPSPAPAPVEEPTTEGRGGIRTALTTAPATPEAPAVAPETPAVVPEAVPAVVPETPEQQLERFRRGTEAAKQEADRINAEYRRRLEEMQNTPIGVDGPVVTQRSDETPVFPGQQATKDTERAQSPIGETAVEENPFPNVIFVPKAVFERGRGVLGGGQTEQMAVQTPMGTDVRGAPAAPELAIIAMDKNGAPITVNSLHTAPLGAWLDDVQPMNDGTAINTTIVNLITSRLKQLVPNIEVHAVSAVEMKQKFASSTTTVLGQYTKPLTEGIPETIVLNASTVADPDTVAYIILHEGTHAATATVLRSDPVLAGGTKLMMLETEHKLTANGSVTKDPTNPNHQFANNNQTTAFKNEREFVAEVFSNSDLQHAMSQIQASSELVKTLGLSQPPKKLNMFQAFVRWVREKVLKLEPSTEMMTMLEAAIRLGSRVIDAQARLSGDPSRSSTEQWVQGLQANQEAIDHFDPDTETAKEIRSLKRQIAQNPGDQSLRMRMKQIQTAVGSQPEIAALADNLRLNIFGGRLPPSVRQGVAFADKMVWLYKYWGSLSQVARVNTWFQPVLRYVERTSLMHRDEVNIQDAAVKVGKDWLRLGPQGDRLGGFVDEIAHMSFRSPQEVAAGVVRFPSQQEFNRLVQKYQLDTAGLDVFNKLTTAMVGPRNPVTGQSPNGGLLGQIEQAIIERIQRRAGPTMAQQIAAVRAQVLQLRARPYFPFTNFGQHYILVKDPAGNFVHFETVERRGLRSAKSIQAKRTAELMKAWRRVYNASPSVGNPTSVPTTANGDIVVGTLPEMVRPMIGMPAILIKEMSAILGLNPDQINNSAMLQYAQGFGTQAMLDPRFQRRYYVPGFGMEKSGLGQQSYSMDLRRSFARFMFHGSRFYSRIKHLDALHELVNQAEMSGLGNKADEIGRFMRDHLQNTIIDAKGDWGLAKGGIFLWALGYVPAAAAQNISQTPTITFPFLGAKFGDVKATAAILKAMVQMKNFMKKGAYNNATSFEMKSFDYGIRTGRITETQAPELAAMSQHGLLLGIGGTRTQRNWSRFMQGSAFMFEMAEQINRRIAWRAALTLATKNPNAPFVRKAVAHYQDEHRQLRQQGFSPAEASAIVTAVAVVEETQGIYARWDRPRFMRGKTAGTVFVFKKYVQFVSIMLGQNPDVTIRYMLMMTLVGGIGAWPFYEEFKSILKAVGRWFDHDFDIELEIRKLILQMFPPSNNPEDAPIMPDLILHGISRKGYGMPWLADHIGSYATGRPGRGFAGPRYTIDPQTGQPIPLGWANNVPFPVLDRSRAISMGIILPPGIDVGKLMLPTDNQEKALAGVAQQASGAVFSVAFNTYKAIMDNQLPASDWKRWEKMEPRMMGNISEFWRSYQQGRERSKGGPSGGATLANYDWGGKNIGDWNIRDTEQFMESLAELAGYNTLRKAARWDMIMAMSEVKMGYDLQRKGLMGHYYEAHAGGNEEEKENVVKAIRAYNDGLPEWAKGMSVQDEDLQKSVAAKYRDKTLKEMGLPSQNRAVPLAREVQKLFPDATIDVRRPPQ